MTKKPKFETVAMKVYTTRLQLEEQVYSFKGKNFINKTHCDKCGKMRTILRAERCSNGGWTFTCETCRLKTK